MQVIEALKPLPAELIRMQMRYRPFGPDDLILSAATKAPRRLPLHRRARRLRHEPALVRPRAYPATTFARSRPTASSAPLQSRRTGWR